MERFHVANDRGEDFDIVYWDNNDDIELIEAYPKYVKPPFMTKYLHYDEMDKDSHCTLTFSRDLTPAFLRN